MGTTRPTHEGLLLGKKKIFLGVLLLFISFLVVRTLLFLKSIAELNISDSSSGLNDDELISASAKVKSLAGNQINSIKLEPANQILVTVDDLLKAFTLEATNSDSTLPPGFDVTALVLGQSSAIFNQRDNLLD